MFLIEALRAAAQQQPSQDKQVIVVTGVYEPIPLEEADRPVQSLDVRNNESTANSLVDFLRLNPSVDLGERAPNGVQTDVSIRGGTFEQTLVLLDGWRINDAQTGHHNMDIPVPLGSVASVEVLPGSGSTLYGSDAIGGVINIVTRPPETSELRLRTSAGNFGVNQQSGSFAVATPTLTEQLSFSRDFSSGFTTDRDYRDLSLASTTNFSSSWGRTEILLANGDHLFGANDFYGDFDSWEHTRPWFAGVRQSLGQSTEISAAFRRHTDLFVLYRDDPEGFTNRSALDSYQAALRRKNRIRKDVRIFYGFEGFHDAIVSSDIGTHARGRLAGYAAVDVRALRRFSLSMGMREEVYRSFQAQFCPTLNGGYWLNSQFKLRAGIGRAFRVPSFTDLYYHDPGNRGSVDLKPERGWTYEAGLDWNEGRRVRGALTVFQRQDHDVIDYVYLPSISIWQAENIQQIRFDGVEASVSTLLRGSQRLDFGYTGLYGSRTPLGDLETRYVFNQPVHSAMVSYESTLPGKLVCRSRLGILKRYQRDPYALWDLYLAEEKTRIHPFLQLTNLTNASYQEIPGVPMPGRAIVVGVELVVRPRKR
jgi:iron complex outermembrane receptor protein